MKSFVLQKSANNEIRIGWQDLPRPKRKGGDSAREVVQEYYSKQVALTETEVVKVGDRGYLIDRVNGCSVLTRDEAECHESMVSRALDIIDDFQHRKKEGKNDYKPGWGYSPKATKFGAYARHTILEAGAIASRGVGCDGRGVEVTLTIPSTTDSSFRAISLWSGYIVNRLLQVIRRNKQNIEWFYVWELQKRGALHLHMALSGVCQRTLLSTGRKVRETWYRLLGEIGVKQGTDLFLSGKGYRRNTYEDFLKGNRVAEIRKSLAAYFAKYVSKNAGGKTKEGEVKGYPPSRWWGISRSLLRKVKEERLNVRITCVSERELTGLLASAIGFIRRYDITRHTSYSFEVSYGKEGNRKQVGFGQRFIYWVADSSYGELGVWVPQLLRYLKAQCSNAVIEGDIDWALHTPAWR